MRLHSEEWRIQSLSPFEYLQFADLLCPRPLSRRLKALLRWSDMCYLRWRSYSPATCSSSVNIRISESPRTRIDQCLIYPMSRLLNPGEQLFHDSPHKSASRGFGLFCGAAAAAKLPLIITTSHLMVSVRAPSTSWNLCEQREKSRYRRQCDTQTKTRHQEAARTLKSHHG